MSEHLTVVSRLTAIDETSPVLERVLANLKKIERAAKRINTFTADKFTKSFDGIAAGLAKTETASKVAASSYSQSWRQAHNERLLSERRLFSNISRMESAAHARRQSNVASIAREHAGISRTRQERSPAAHRSGNRVGYTPVPMAYGAMLAGGGIAASMSAFKRRMEADTAETKAVIFGELSRDSIKGARKDWIDQSAIKFGNSPAKVVDAFTESLKAGFGNDAAKQITEGALKAQSALELDIGQLIRLAGKTATIFGGDVKNVDPVRVVRLMNAIGVAAAETAADPNEVVEAFKKGNAALAMSKMAEGDLAAILSVGISGGIQPAKAGNAVSNLISTLVGGKSARGQKGKDLNEAARILGFEGRGQMADMAAANPTELLITMFQKINALKEQSRTKVARLLGGSEWDDEILMLAKPVDSIIGTIAAVKSKTERLDEASKERINSLRGRWDSIGAAAVLGWEKIGAGFESAFTEISDYFRDHIGSADFDSLSPKVAAFVDGVKRGFGFDSWKQMLDGMFAGANTGDPKKYAAVGKGVAEGLRTVWSAFSTAFSGLATMFGVDGRDAQALAKFAAEIIGLTIALRVLAPVVAVIGTLAAGIKWIGGALVAVAGVFGGGGILATITGGLKALAKGIIPAIVLTLGKVILDALFGVVDFVLDRIAPNRNKLDSKRLMDRGIFEKFRDSFLSNEEFSEKYRVAPQAPPSVKPQSFIGGGAGDGASDRPNGLLKRSSFTSGDSTADAMRSPAAGALVKPAVPSFGQGDDTANAFRTPAARALATPSVPSFDGSGGSSGSLDKNAFEKTFAGTAMAGKFDQVSSAAKANGVDPALLAGVMAHESGRGRFLSGNNPGGVMDASAGWATKKKFADLNGGIDATASAVGKNFRRANGDIDKMGAFYAPPGASNDPRSLNENWPNGVRRQMAAMGGGAESIASGVRGSSGSGDAVSSAERYLGQNEYRDTASLSRYIGADPRGAANAWCARFVNASLKSAGGQGTGSAVANSFQRWGERVSDLSQIKRNDVLVEPKGRGPDVPGGHVGLATGLTRLKNGRLQVEMLSGNQGDTVTKRFYDADRIMGRRGAQPPANDPASLTGNPPNESLIGNTPGNSLIGNVPVSPSLTSPHNSAWNGGGAGGPVAININGGSHDPEALATLVQRRVDESMNWRTHDSENEYS